MTLEIFLSPRLTLLTHVKNLKARLTHNVFLCPESTKTYNKAYLEKEKFHLLDDSGLRKISWVNLALRFFTWVKRVNLGLRNISRVKRGQPGT